MVLRQASLACGLEIVVLVRAPPDSHHPLSCWHPVSSESDQGGVQMVKYIYPCYYTLAIYQAHEEDGDGPLQGRLMNLILLSTRPN